MGKQAVRYPELAARIADRMKEIPEIPEGHGQKTWIAREFKRRFDVEVGREVVRTWVAGEREPRPAARAQLANILGMDVAWLMTGTSSPSIGRTISSASEVIVAFVLKSSGWSVRSSADQGYEFDAEIGARRYKIACRMPLEMGHGTFSIKLPRNIAEVILLVPYVSIDDGCVALGMISGEPGAEVAFRIGPEGNLVSENCSCRRLKNLAAPSW